MDDYDLTIFVVRYEYFRFDVSGDFSISITCTIDIPGVEAAESAAARDAEATGQDVEEAVSNVRHKSGQQVRRAGGVKNEINVGYELRCLIYTTNHGKKQLIGLQGDFFKDRRTPI